VFEGEREAGRDVQMAQTLADLNREGYDAASAQTMAQLAAQQSAMGAGAAGMMNVGTADTALNAANLEALYKEFMREQQNPYQQLSALTGGAGAIPAGYGKTTESYNPGIFGYLSAAASIGSGFA
jgi:hypothetical protein